MVAHSVTPVLCVLAGVLALASAQKCSNSDQATQSALSKCAENMKVAQTQYAAQQATSGSAVANPHSRFCEALNQYHTCFCQQAAGCGGNTGGAAAIEKLMRDTLYADGGACSSDGRKKLEAGSPEFCKPVLSIVCESQGCNANLFGNGLSPTCAAALDRQFSATSKSELPLLKSALQGLQGLKRQTHFVASDKEIEDGGIYVPECSQPTDFFACVSTADELDPQPTPAPGPGVATSVAQKVVFCKDENRMNDEDKEAYIALAPRIIGTGTAAVCPVDGSGNQFAPIEQQFGGILPPGSEKRGRCCDRPLKPGTCDRKVRADAGDNEAHTVCVKRWVGGSIQRFKKACESTNGPREETPYGTAYFLSARAEKLVGKIKNIYEIVDGNVLCWPRTQCIAGDLQKHLESRAAECTANFMDECTYTARPIECDEPPSADVANPNNANCQEDLIEDTGAGYKDLVEKWDKQNFGYTKCDLIMGKDIDGQFTDTCDISLSNPVVRGTSNEAARAVPGALSITLAAAVLVLRHM